MSWFSKNYEKAALGGATALALTAARLLTAIWTGLLVAGGLDWMHFRRRVPRGVRFGRFLLDRADRSHHLHCGDARRDWGLSHRWVDRNLDHRRRNRGHRPDCRGRWPTLCWGRCRLDSHRCHRFRWLVAGTGMVAAHHQGKAEQRTADPVPNGPSLHVSSRFLANPNGCRPARPSPRSPRSRASQRGR